MTDNDKALEWLESQTTLHQQVDILYVVDGFQVTLVREGAPPSQSFWGESVVDALLSARAALGETK